MNTEEKRPERKGTRLHNFDYGSTGAYFVTVCTQGRQRVLSEIVVPDHTATNCSQNLLFGIKKKSTKYIIFY